MEDERRSVSSVCPPSLSLFARYPLHVSFISIAVCRIHVSRPFLFAFYPLPLQGQKRFSLVSPSKYILICLCHCVSTIYKIWENGRYGNQHAVAGISYVFLAVSLLPQWVPATIDQNLAMSFPLLAMISLPGPRAGAANKRYDYNYFDSDLKMYFFFRNRFLTEVSVGQTNF